MEISELIKSARIEKGMTQQQLAESVYVTRQTISKWELGKSIPDEASLTLLYQCLDIKENQKRQLKKLIVNKQNILLLIFAIIFSPAAIGIRYVLYKMGKLEDRKFIVILKTVCFIVFALYLRTLKEQVAYLFIGTITVMYLIYQFYISGLDME